MLALTYQDTLSFPIKTETERQHLLLPTLGCVRYDYYNITLASFFFNPNYFILSYSVVVQTAMQSVRDLRFLQPLC